MIAAGVVALFLPTGTAHAGSECGETGKSQGCQFGRLFKIGINAEIDLRGFPWIGVRYRA
jgi:hypothetical protein